MDSCTSRLSLIFVIVSSLSQSGICKSCFYDHDCFGFNVKCRSLSCVCDVGYTKDHMGTCTSNIFSSEDESGFVQTMFTVYVVAMIFTICVWVFMLILGIYCYRKRSKIVIPGRVLQAGVPGLSAPNVIQQPVMYNQPPSGYPQKSQGYQLPQYSTQAV